MYLYINIFYKYIYMQIYSFISHLTAHNIKLLNANLLGTVPYVYMALLKLYGKLRSR